MEDIIFKNHQHSKRIWKEFVITNLRECMISMSKWMLYY